MTIDTLINCLEGVKATGPNKWSAKCPAHEDKHPSLGVAVTSQGMVLIHCRAGCESLSVLHALGLTLADLYPDAGPDRLGPEWWAKKKDEPKSVTEARTVLLLVEADRIGGKIISERSKREEIDAFKTVKRWEKQRERC